MKVAAIVLCTIFIVAIVFFAATPIGREVWNRYVFGLEKADEVSYETRKLVEDTARSLIASYNADVEIYKAYKDSDDEKLLQYAESAKMRAIRTATTYNEHMLKNSFVWKDNIPADIYRNLPVSIE